MPEVADFNAPGFTAVDAISLYFQSTVIFPRWLSIANKEHSVFVALFLAIENTPVFILLFFHGLINVHLTFTKILIRIMDGATDSPNYALLVNGPNI